MSEGTFSDVTAKFILWTRVQGRYRYFPSALMREPPWEQIRGGTDGPVSLVWVWDSGWDVLVRKCYRIFLKKYSSRQTRANSVDPNLTQYWIGKTKVLFQKATTVFTLSNGTSYFFTILGPVVQSVVSLTSSLRVISLTVLADSIYNILIFFAEKMWVALQKLLTFFSAKISAYLRITWCKF